MSELRVVHLQACGSVDGVEAEAKPLGWVVYDVSRASHCGHSHPTKEEAAEQCMVVGRLTAMSYQRNAGEILFVLAKDCPSDWGKSYLLGNAMMRVCGWFDEKVDERTNFGDFWESGV